MKRILLAVLALCIMASPALAARFVYLKDGSIITAKKVWRTKGTVHVLVNRDTLTEFSTSEVNMKRTFVKKRRPAPKTAPAATAPATATTAAKPAAAVPAANTGDKKPGVTLPSLPSVPKGIDDLKSKDEGAIRKQKREMKEQLDK